MQPGGWPGVWMTVKIPDYIPVFKRDICQDARRTGAKVHREALRIVHESPGIALVDRNLALHMCAISFTRAVWSKWQWVRTMVSICSLYGATAIGMTPASTRIFPTM